MRLSIITIKAILIICASAAVSFAQPQPPDTMWTKTFGGSSGDYGNSVQQTSDGGFIIAGYTESYGAGYSDVYLIKTDASGDSLWTKTFGGSNSDYGRSVQQTSDGGYIIAGYTYSYGAGNWDVYLIKTGASGDQQWYRTFGGSSADEGYSVQQTFDGGYIIAGYTFSYGAGGRDVYLIKTDAFGNQQWQQTFGGSSPDWGESVQQTSDGGYIIAGLTYSYGAGEEDVYLIKTDTNGNESWSQTFGGSDDEYVSSVQQTSDGGYIIAGNTESYGAGYSDVYLIKTNASGDTVWTKTFGGYSGDCGMSVQQTSDGCYIIAGYTSSYGAGSVDVYLIKTDASGYTVWTKTFGGSASDLGYSVQQTSDGGYIVAGWTDSFGSGSRDVWLLKTAPDIVEPLINSEPLTCNFGTVEIGYPSNLQIIVMNEGWGELTISEFLLSSPFSCAIISGDSTLFHSDTTIVEITFDPQEIGYYVDSLGIVSNAVNADTVWVYLEGEGGIVPAPVQGLTIEVQGNDAVLTWNPVDTTIHGNPITVDYYLIYFETDPYSEFEFLDYTAGTVFTHDAVAQFSPAMFYFVEAYVGEIGILDEITAGDEPISRTELLEEIFTADEAD